MSDKAWGGRFEEDTARAALEFSESVSFDRRLAGVDIRGSIAHAEMLGKTGVIGSDDVTKIVAGLQAIEARIREDKLEWQAEREDVHMNIEAVLTEDIGEAGGRLHTGRSRNDQVATDMRLWTREACIETTGHIDQLVAVLVARAEEQIDVILPGYTHLQRAQPVRLSHHLLAWCEMLLRDRGRLRDAQERMNECPLGSGALSGTTFPIDRQHTARALGFRAPTRNSLDSVADRDFLFETLAALTNCALHLSRIAEELVLWSSQEFGFLRMGDKVTTGSSMMPQKKNPDMAELVRGKCGRVVGSLVNLAVTLKGLPLTYNRDLQEDKPPVFDAFDTVNDSLNILALCLASAEFQADAMRRALREGFVEATEIADWLTARGVPFRNAHHVAGKLVALCIERNVTLSELPLTAFQELDPTFDASIFEALDPETAVDRRDVFGGPARGRVVAALNVLRRELEDRDVQIDRTLAALR